MKKRAFIIPVIILVALSGLTDLALSLSQDTQWTPYILTWKQKLPPSKKQRQSEITVCSPKKDAQSISSQR